MSQAKLKFGCCERQTSSTGFLHCQSCKFRYHLNCVNIQRPLKDLTEDFKLKYICPGCHSKLPKVDNTNTPIRPSSQSATCYQLDEPSTNVNNRRGGHPLHQHEPSVTTEDIRLIIKEELESVFNNFKVSILKEVERKTQEVLDRFNQISDALKIFEQNQANLKDEVTLNSNRINTLEAENTSLRESVADLRSRLARSEQYSRATNLEIQNVPEFKTENLYSVVRQIAAVSGYKLEEIDIQQCTRIAKINNESRRPRSIIVKFNTQRIRDGFLAAALQFNKKNKNPTDKLNTSQLGIGGDKKPVFVVEHLAPAQKALHAAARAKAKELHYKFVWVRGVIETGDEPAACNGRRTLVLANHQSTADVPMLMAAWNPRPGILPNLMWIMDRVFKFTNFGIVSVLHEDFFIQALIRDHVPTIHKYPGLEVPCVPGTRFKASHVTPLDVDFKSHLSGMMRILPLSFWTK
ncbi:unnamed protein product [Spodoptera littoralis]|uniref:PHD-type domain-containing protein n=1 Tax=Spodoptera littoralis TaxID=7109 RepID=A0A9P0MX88_SPOLI|nr:unnamed protein product [Spodoptera littoralis]CAH1636731.1 unnamed protein product [Spodoptera littoralis]